MPSGSPFLDSIAEALRLVPALNGRSLTLNRIRSVGLDTSVVLGMFFSCGGRPPNALIGRFLDGERKAVAPDSLRYGPMAAARLGRALRADPPDLPARELVAVSEPLNAALLAERRPCPLPLLEAMVRAVRLLGRRHEPNSCVSFGMTGASCKLSIMSPDDRSVVRRGLDVFEEATLDRLASAMAATPLAEVAFNLRTAHDRPASSGHDLLALEAELDALLAALPGAA